MRIVSRMADTQLTATTTPPMSKKRVSQKKPNHPSLIQCMNTKLTYALPRRDSLGEDAVRDRQSRLQQTERRSLHRQRRSEAPISSMARRHDDPRARPRPDGGELRGASCRGGSRAAEHTASTAAKEEGQRARGGRGRAGRYLPCQSRLRLISRQGQDQRSAHFHPALGMHLTLLHTRTMQRKQRAR